MEFFHQWRQQTQDLVGQGYRQCTAAIVTENVPNFKLNTVAPLLVATLNRGHPLYGHISFPLLLSMYLLVPLTKGHLSNVDTVSWQIGLTPVVFPGQFFQFSSPPLIGTPPSTISFCLHERGVLWWEGVRGRITACTGIQSTFHQTIMSLLERCPLASVLWDREHCITNCMRPTSCDGLRKKWKTFTKLWRRIRGDSKQREALNKSLGSYMHLGKWLCTS